MTRAGIKDVALAAGVSITTVSHALNDKGRIPEATRERVRRVAGDLGYQPTSAARNLGGHRTGLISIALSRDEGHCVGMSDSAYFLELVRGATVAAVESGFALVLSDTGRRGASSLNAVRVDGGVVIDPVRDDAHVARLRDAGAKLVTTGRVPGEDDGCWVDNDHPRGLRRLLDHLGGTSERVALVAIPRTTTYAMETWDTYHDWCSDHGQAPVTVPADGDLTEMAGFSAAEALMASPHPPDAVCAPLDRLALGVLLYARGRGIGVPADVRLACVTNGELTRAARPQLTALELYPQTIGMIAVQTLVDLIEGRESENRQIVVPTRLLRRASSRARR